MSCTEYRVEKLKSGRKNSVKRFDTLITCCCAFTPQCEHTNVTSTMSVSYVRVPKMRSMVLFRAVGGRVLTCLRYGTALSSHGEGLAASPGGS